MLSLRVVESLISIITFLIVYLFIVSFAGFTRAWAAKKMGDDTPERLGFLTLNPAVHVDPIGLIFLLLPFFRFGWGRHIPINPLNIHGSWRGLRLFFAFFSDVFMYLAMATAALTKLILLFGPSALPLSTNMMLSGNLSQMRFALAYPDSPSLLISIALILIAWVYLSVFLAVFTFIINGIELGMMILLERSPEYMRYTGSFMFFIPIILIFSFVSPILRVLAVWAIANAGYFLASLFGGL